eukprot:CAMPEP_0198648208 /NCGR_PEP_ID=MMETSP1467-20131203/3314_1 /TAXON_ID=1462469 /ORGANISM="unid. sp., Strain CCMP2135" /LENGTH=204 /DNA_ID=CAMNT_0044383909 /DNA_START=81 /DNA_END=695 /DNA_ORIENTATION=-
MSYIGRGMLAKYLPKSVQNFIEGLQFRPQKPSDMEPSPLVRQKLKGVDRIQGYRYPAPGSRPPARIPRVDNTDDVFDIKFLGKDTRRAPRNHIIFTNKKCLDSEEIKAITTKAESVKLDWGSSGKFGNPAVKEYDPTGLRSSMTATHEALAKSLEEHKPTQLVHYEWWDEQDAIIADAKAKGIPPPPGKPPAWKYPKERYQASW